MADTVGKRKHVWLGHVLRHESLLHDIIEGRMRGEGYKMSEKNASVERPGGKRSYTEVKPDAQDRAGWRVKMS